MAEYRNGLNYRGQMAVEKKDVNSDVQTGRAVFVDEDKYEKDADYKAKVDKCIEQGFHRVSVDGSSGGEGGGVGTEPLIAHLTYDANEQNIVPDSEELNTLKTALANHDKALWVQLNHRETFEGDTQEYVMFVAPASYHVEPVEDILSISASAMTDNIIEAVSIEWDGQSISGGYASYQL